jgi:hypoxanthine phosphoribosyltransferase
MPAIMTAAGHGPRHRLERVFSAKQVGDRIEELVEDLHRAYENRDLLLVVIAEGARRFAEALVDGLEERLVFPSVHYVRASRTRGTELVQVQLESVDPGQFENRDVLVVDDIADEGRTLEAVLAVVSEGEPRSLEVTVLVSKRERRCVDLEIRYVGFEVERGWVVGFGMDLDGRYRELDDISLAVPEEA